MLIMYWLNVQKLKGEKNEDISVDWPLEYETVSLNSFIFVKLEELHIVTARKPLIHQNQPVAQYLHKIQQCML